MTFTAGFLLLPYLILISVKINIKLFVINKFSIIKIPNTSNIIQQICEFLINSALNKMGRVGMEWDKVG
jgi:hypothetical protein